jgi:hypothetical protein
VGREDRVSKGRVLRMVWGRDRRVEGVDVGHCDEM